MNEDLLERKLPKVPFQNVKNIPGDAETEQRAFEIRKILRKIFACLKWITGR